MLHFNLSCPWCRTVVKNLKFNKVKRMIIDYLLIIMLEMIYVSNRFELSHRRVSDVANDSVKFFVVIQTPVQMVRLVKEDNSFRLFSQHTLSISTVL